MIINIKRAVSRPNDVFLISSFTPTSFYILDSFFILLIQAVHGNVT